MVFYIFHHLSFKPVFNGISERFATPTLKQIDGTLYHLRTSYT